MDQAYNKMVFFLIAGLLDAYILACASIISSFEIFIFGILTYTILISGLVYESLKGLIRTIRSSD